VHEKHLCHEDNTALLSVEMEPIFFFRLCWCHSQYP